MKMRGLFAGSIATPLVVVWLAFTGCSNDGAAQPPDAGSADQATASRDSSAAPDAVPLPDAPAVQPDSAQVACGMCDSPCADSVMCTPENPPAQMPGQYTVGEFVIGGFEYWPWALPQPLYPDKIQWGYNAGGKTARACMAAAYRRLVRILQKPPKELVEFKKKTGVYAFYNWNNDYTGAAGDDIAPAQYQLPWLYNKNLIKWISGTHRDGKCVVLKAKHLVDFAKKCIKSFPNC